jgi:hypothetical protein
VTDKTKRFLQKLKDKGHWNDDYDYSKVEYVNAHTKVPVIYKKYDTEHLMIPSTLMKGYKCNMYNVVDANDYLIRQFKEVHGDRYDYSKVNYMGNSTKVTIICEEHGHGEFEQLPNSHKQGKGCSKCAGNNKLTTEEVIEQFREVHGDKYDYSKVEYIGSKTKVTIICPEHGEFEQEPCNHKEGRGCPTCGANKLTTEEVMKRFREVHGDKYDYSKVEYIEAKTKVTIICPKHGHGEFEQKPCNHKWGQGCPKCSVSYVPTTEEVIEQFREVHGDKYDYSKVGYIDSKTKVTIICPKHGHGEFKQLPNSHKSGFGCPKCGGNYVPTTEEVIEQFREVHGDKYDYSKVEYIGSKTKVTIICPEHGEFEQTPSSHKRGSDCFNCGNRVPTTEEVIEQFREVHGDKYDYSNVNYIGADTKVTIICPEHGEFKQPPSGHKRGADCPKCVGNVKLTTEEIIEQFREAHGDKYDYSKVNYIDGNTKVIIICPEHGEFEQLPNSHKQGKGCFKCVGKGLTTKEIIEQFREVHGDKYDYSKVEYIHSTTKVTIICPEHGEFEQRPCNHKQGNRCPSCTESKGEREIRNLLIDKDIDFNQEHTFDDCKNKLPLRFDFYLPEHNVCIEYQGIQHYEPVDFFGGVSGLENRQYLDKIKDEYCIDNNIQLLKIRYDEDVSNVLNEYLNSKCTINLQH